MKNPDSKITIEEVIHQYIVLLFAGVDTTSHLTGNAFWILAKYPEI
jgi:cytochrome P450